MGTSGERPARGHGNFHADRGDRCEEARVVRAHVQLDRHRQAPWRLVSLGAGGQADRCNQGHQGARTSGQQLPYDPAWLDFSHWLLDELHWTPIDHGPMLKPLTDVEFQVCAYFEKACVQEDVLVLNA